MEGWNTEKGLETYRISEWGGGYFSANSEGNITVSPGRDGSKCDLFDLVKNLKDRGIEPPILIRFDGIIKDRIKSIQEAFQKAIEAWNYGGNYRVTYPIKVNQQKHVVETVRTSGHLRNLGLEVGSKPELLAVLAMHDLPDAPLLCNGYKDSEYIELALLGRKFGRRSIIIVEQFYELNEVLKIASQLNVEAEIGFRMKPSTKGSGLWVSSSGDCAKFGLNTTQIIAGIEILNEQGKLDWLKLLHFHVGSQIPAINAFKKVLKEATRMYVELAALAPSLSILDIGGGLAVDYDGSSSNFESSMNYSLDEYAESVVAAIYEACDQAGLSHPDIISESGRALVAHHAVLVTEVIDMAPALYGESPTVETAPSEHPLVLKALELYQDINQKNCVQTLHEAAELKDDILEQFTAGNLTLSDRAYAERMYRHLLSKIRLHAAGLKQKPEDLDKVEDELRDLFFCNFSVFQSAPDSWAIDQLFPIAPIHRLGEEPVRRGILADLTCDSDGQIDRFIDLKDISSSLPLHALREDQPYYLGVFLVGAYQEILGDLHNLFGDTNAVHVNIDVDGEVEITEVVRGDTVREVLEYVEYDAGELQNRLRMSLERAIRGGQLSNDEMAKIQKRYREALDGYTYLVKY